MNKTYVTTDKCDSRFEKFDDRLDKIEKNHLKHIEIAIVKIQTEVKNIKEEMKAYWGFMKKMMIGLFIAAFGGTVSAGLILRLFGI